MATWKFLAINSQEFITVATGQLIKSIIMTRFLYRLTVLLVFLNAITLRAQEQRFKASILGGFNFAQIDGDLLYGYHQIGFCAGPQVNAILSKRWEWGVGIQYAQQGARRAPRDYASSIYQSIRLNLVEVPVLFHFNEWKFQLDGGFSYGRLINSKIIDVTGVDITETQRLSDSAISLVLGGSFKFSDHWGLSMRFTRSLTNFRKNSADGTFISRNVGIRMAYFF
jgi:hypothetical protein